MKIFPNPPIYVLLDTSVVQNLHTFSKYIFHNYLSEEMDKKLIKLGNKIRNDIYALKIIISPDSPVIPVISNLSLYELSNIGNETKRENLLKWGFGLLETSQAMNLLYCEDVDDSLDMKNEYIHFSSEQTILSDFLKDKIDRLLLGECWKSDFDAFITMDYKTILKYRSELIKEGINVHSPSMWLKSLGWEIEIFSASWRAQR